MKQVLLAGILVVLLAATSAVAQSVVSVVDHPQYGMILTNADGMTLYLFTRDEPGVSNCTGGCLQAWPPLLLGDGSLPQDLPGTFDVIDGAEGGQQVTYNGWPLYTWVTDQAAGDTTGQGFNDVWYVVNVNPTLQLTSHPELGDILVGPNGMTLYLFTRDEPGVSNCEGGCLQAWPPLLVGYTPSAAEGMMGELATITRDDGTMQVTYNGMPLYYWVQDQQIGDVTGQGFNEVWYVVNP